MEMFINASPQGISKRQFGIGQSVVDGIRRFLADQRQDVDDARDGAEIIVRLIGRTANRIEHVGKDGGGFLKIAVQEMKPRFTRHDGVMMVILQEVFRLFETALENQRVGHRVDGESEKCVMPRQHEVQNGIQRLQIDNHGRNEMACAERQKFIRKILEPRSIQKREDELVWRCEGVFLREMLLEIFQAALMRFHVFRQQRVADIAGQTFVVGGTVRHDERKGFRDGVRRRGAAGRREEIDGAVQKVVRKIGEIAALMVDDFVRHHAHQIILQIAGVVRGIVRQVFRQGVSDGLHFRHCQ